MSETKIYLELILTYVLLLFCCCSITWSVIAQLAGGSEVPAPGIAGHEALFVVVDETKEISLFSFGNGVVSKSDFLESTSLVRASSLNRSTALCVLTHGDPFLPVI
jgi:hypothetical protein